MLTRHERRRFLRTMSLGAMASILGKGPSFGQGPVKVMPKLKFLTEESKGYNDARWLFNRRLNFRPAYDTVFKLDYQHNWMRDGFNTESKSAGLIFGVASYF